MALPSIPLGRLLVDTGLVAQPALDEVLEAQKADARRLGELLVERGLVRPQQLAQMLSHQLSCPWVSLQRVEIRPQVLALLPRDIAIAHEVVPVHVRTTGRDQKTLYVATADPTDDVALAECARAAAMPIKPMIAMSDDIRTALGRFYGVAPALPQDRVSDVPEQLDDSDLIAVVDRVPAELRRASVLALNAPERFLEQCKAALAKMEASLVEGTFIQAGELVAQHKPCALVVTEDVYAFDRSGLNRLAIENDCVLVVWSEDVEIRHLEPLLRGALERWRRSAYEKGAILDGRWELLRDLGGPVPTARWEVRHARTGRRAVLNIGLASDKHGDETASVKRQQVALARIMHPGALDLRDAGTTERGDAYVVLESLEGKSLEGLFAARGRLPTRDACAVVVQIADVLAAAHAESILHADLRPEHVVVTRDSYGVERVRLGGWQSARLVEGTFDGSADIRALGTLAFEALLGRAPRPGEKADADLPKAVLDALSRAIGDDPQKRFPSMRDVVAAFESAVPDARGTTRFLEAARKERGIATGRPPAPGPEQRRHTRAAYRTPVRVEVAGVGAIDGRSEDISQSGLFVVTRASVPNGSQVTVRFALPVDGKVVAESGVVRWSRTAHVAEGGELWAIGIELDAPGSETKSQVERYVTLMSTET